VPIAFAGAAAFLTLYATQPLLPLLAKTFSASTFAVGLTVTAPTIAIALVAPAVGRFADRVGLRRVIVGCAFLLSVATALAAASTTLAQLIACRLLQGIFTPGVFAGTVAYIHETWPPSRTGRATAIYMTGTIVGGFVGRALAGLIAADVNWHLSFAVLSVLHLAIAVVLWLRLPDERDARLQPRAPADGTRGVRRAGSAGFDGARGLSRPSAVSAAMRLLRNSQLRATYAIGFCVLFTNVAMFTYVTFHLAAPPYRLSTAALGWLFIVYIIGAVVTPYGGRWIDRYGHRVGLASAMGIGAVGALLTLAPSFLAIAAGLALASTGVFVAQTTTSSYIGAVTTDDRALAVGLYSTFYYTGGSLGGALPATVWNLAGWPGCVALVVLVQTTGALVALTRWKGKGAAASVERTFESGAGL
jgi:MFS transporter, YNFM family, putative membrane transport protein